MRLRTIEDLQREVTRLRRDLDALKASARLPFGGRRQRMMPNHVRGCVATSGQYCGCPDLSVSLFELPDLVCSDHAANGTHLPVIDIDLPCRLVESSTPGHFHLYIDAEVEPLAYFKMLEAMAAAGIVESGYAFASKLRGYSAVRHPDRLAKR